MAARRTARQVRSRGRRLSSPYRPTATACLRQWCMVRWRARGVPIAWCAADRRPGRNLTKYLTLRWMVKRSTNSIQRLLSSSLSLSLSKTHYDAIFHVNACRIFKLSLLRITTCYCSFFDQVCLNLNKIILLIKTRRHYCTKITANRI